MTGGGLFPLPAVAAGLHYDLCCQAFWAEYCCTHLSHDHLSHDHFGCLVAVLTPGL